MRSFALLRFVARRLWYRPLPELIGRAVTITGLERAESEVRRVTGDALAGCILARPISEGALFKYGILDLEFEAPERFQNPAPLRGVPLLKDLGFVSKSSYARRDDTLEDFLSFMDVVREEIQEGRTIVKLFLEGAPDWKRREELRNSPMKVSRDYFPALFALEDACVTNTGYVWMNKHFYL